MRLVGAGWALLAAWLVCWLVGALLVLGVPVVGQLVGAGWALCV